MNEKTKKSVAESLETEEILIPHMPFLLQAFWDLGSAIEEIVQAAGKLPISAHPSRSLDLGCGKGAVSIRLAKKYGFKVTVTSRIYRVATGELIAEFDDTEYIQNVELQLLDVVAEKIDTEIRKAIGK